MRGGVGGGRENATTADDHSVGIRDGGSGDWPRHHLAADRAGPDLLSETWHGSDAVGGRNHGARDRAPTLPGHGRRAGLLRRLSGRARACRGTWGGGGVERRAESSGGGARRWAGDVL